MKVIGNFTLVPVNAGVSLSPYVAACQQVLEDSGLEFELHANGTNVSGEWQSVFDTIHRCHEEVHRMGVDRIFTSMQVGTRIDRDQNMADKVQSVKNKLEA